MPKCHFFFFFFTKFSKKKKQNRTKKLQLTCLDKLIWPFGKLLFMQQIDQKYTLTQPLAAQSPASTLTCICRFIAGMQSAFGVSTARQEGGSSDYCRHSKAPYYTETRKCVWLCFFQWTSQSSEKSALFQLSASWNVKFWRAPLCDVTKGWLNLFPGGGCLVLPSVIPGS